MRGRDRTGMSVSKSKSRITWLENLAPPQEREARFETSHLWYRGKTVEVVWPNAGLYRFEEISDRESHVFGDAEFYESWATALLYLSESKERAFVLDKRPMDHTVKWWPEQEIFAVRNVVIAHHSLQFKHSDAQQLWKGGRESRLCRWSEETWSVPNPGWARDCLDVHVVRDTLFLAGSQPIFIELARIATAMVRNPNSDIYSLSSFERPGAKKSLSLLKILPEENS